MKFELPTVINDAPDKGELRKKYGRGYLLKIVYKTAVKVWWRTIHSERQNHRCCWCGCRMTDERLQPNSATLEHIVPRASGGEDIFDNTAAACYDCNHKRGTLEIEEFLEIIRSENAKCREAICKNKSNCS